MYGSVYDAAEELSTPQIVQVFAPEASAKHDLAANIIDGLSLTLTIGTACVFNLVKHSQPERTQTVAS